MLRSVEGSADYLLVETTGLADPGPVADMLAAAGARLDSVVAARLTPFNPAPPLTLRPAPLTPGLNTLRLEPRTRVRLDWGPRVNSAY